MSSKIALENNEDLDNVQLVRMEDVQPPSRDRSTDNVMYKVGTVEFLIDADDIKCEDSNEVVIEDCSNDAFEISDVKQEIIKMNTHPQDSWPTLEILPGGIIKNGDRLESSSNLCDDVTFDYSELMYACAKCPEKFKSMFYLVKHVRWHEIEQKKQIVERKQVNLPVNKAKCKKQITKRLMKKS